MDLVSKAPPLETLRLVSDTWTEPFWTAAAEHRLVAARCEDCGTRRMPPTPFCPNCLSQKVDWEDLGTRGTIYTYTIVSRAVMPELEPFIPYVPALIEFPSAPGIRLISNVVDTALWRLQVGAEVELLWKDREDGFSFPLFRIPTSSA